jgi:hypothetical protein
VAPCRQDHQRSRNLWRMFVAAMLIGLVLYNPFLALVNHSGGFTYQALARNRATVGASEMQHFTPIQKDAAPFEATVERICAELVVEKTDFPSPIFQPEILPQRPELTNSVWFRPPPAAR